MPAAAQVAVLIFATYAKLVVKSIRKKVSVGVWLFGLAFGMFLTRPSIEQRHSGAEVLYLRDAARLRRGSALSSNEAKLQKYALGMSRWTQNSRINSLIASSLDFGTA